MPLPPVGAPLIEMSEGMKIHYRLVGDNITFLKRQQWTITNHSLVLYGAVLALAKDTTDIERTILTGLALLGCAVAIYFMCHTQISMTRYYRNLFDIHQKYFAPEERDSLQMKAERPDFNHNGAFIWGLIIANGMAFAITFYFIWWKNGIPILHGTQKTAAQIASYLLS